MNPVFMRLFQQLMQNPQFQQQMQQRQQPGMPDNTTMNYNGFGDPAAQREQMMMNRPPKQPMGGYNPLATPGGTNQFNPYSHGTVSTMPIAPQSGNASMDYNGFGNPAAQRGAMLSNRPAKGAFMPQAAPAMMGGSSPGGLLQHFANAKQTTQSSRFR